LPDWSVASTTNQATEPLVKLALLHYQFEAIHPFHGGNGRTGRILNLLFLLQQRRLDIPVLYMLDAIETTSRATLEKVDAILALMADTFEKIRSARPALPARELAEVLFAQPTARIAFVEEHRIAKRQTASRYFRCSLKSGCCARFGAVMCRFPTAAEASSTSGRARTEAPRATHRCGTPSGR